MPRRSKQTFEHMLVEVAPRNVQVLERRAERASSLAEAYPENEAAFRAIESEAIQQMFRILTHGNQIQERRATEDCGALLLA